MLFGQHGCGRAWRIGVLLVSLMVLASPPSWAAGQDDLARTHVEGSTAQPGAAAPATALETSFYAALEGRPENDGSSAKPWPSVEYAPTTDFWGRPLPRGKAPDLGAFVFVPSLAAEKARIGWYGWPYRFAPQTARRQVIVAPDPFGW